MNKEILKERVVVEWRNKCNEACGLGCATAENDLDPSLMFTVFLDDDRVLAMLRLSVTVKGGGRLKLRPFDLIFPLHSAAFDFQTIKVAEIQQPSVRHAIKKARLSRSGEVHHVQIRLSEDTSRVVTPYKKEGRFATTSDTAFDLLSGLFSLSNALDYSVYMGMSNYADVGLTAIKTAWQRRGLRLWPPEEINTFYDGRGIMTTSEENVTSGRRKNVPRKSDAPSRTLVADGNSAHPMTPPPYEEHQAPESHVQVRDTPSQDRIFRQILRECSPGYYANAGSIIRVEESISSERAEGSLVSEEDVGPTQTTPFQIPFWPEDLTVSKRDTHFHLDHPVIPDCEKDLAPSIAAVQTGYKRKRIGDNHPPAEDRPHSRLERWLRLALQKNERIYENPALADFFNSLSDHSDADDADLDVKLAYATAVVACDAKGEWCQHLSAFVDLVGDFQNLVLWAIRRDRAAEVRLWPAFMELGSAARERLNTGQRDEYDQIKAGILADLLLQKFVPRREALDPSEQPVRRRHDTNTH